MFYFRNRGEPFKNFYIVSEQSDIDSAYVLFCVWYWAQSSEELEMLTALLSFMEKRIYVSLAKKKKKKRAQGQNGSVWNDEPIQIMMKLWEIQINKQKVYYETETACQQSYVKVYPFLTRLLFLLICWQIKFLFKEIQYINGFYVQFVQIV